MRYWAGNFDIFMLIQSYILAVLVEKQKRSKIADHIVFKFNLCNSTITFLSSVYLIYSKKKKKKTANKSYLFYFYCIVSSFFQAQLGLNLFCGKA